MPGRCDVCKAPCQGDLCQAHTQALQERPDENPQVLHRYAQAGLDRLALSLTNHERFAAWLRTREEEPMHSDFKYDVNIDGQWLPAWCAEAKDGNNGVFIYVDTTNDSLHTVEASRGSDAGQFRDRA